MTFHSADWVAHTAFGPARIRAWTALADLSAAPPQLPSPELPKPERTLRIVDNWLQSQAPEVMK